MSFIDEHGAVYGVEPICAVLPIAPSTCDEHRRERLNPDIRAQRVKRVWDENWGL